MSSGSQNQLRVVAVMASAVAAEARVGVAKAAGAMAEVMVVVVMVVAAKVEAKEEAAMAKEKVDLGRETAMVGRGGRLGQPSHRTCRRHFRNLPIRDGSNSGQSERVTKQQQRQHAHEAPAGREQHARA